MKLIDLYEKVAERVHAETPPPPFAPGSASADMAIHALSTFTAEIVVATLEALAEEGYIDLETVHDDEDDA